MTFRTIPVSVYLGVFWLLATKSLTLISMPSGQTLSGYLTVICCLVLILSVSRAIFRIHKLGELRSALRTTPFFVYCWIVLVTYSIISFLVLLTHQDELNIFGLQSTISLIIVCLVLVDLSLHRNNKIQTETLFNFMRISAVFSGVLIVILQIYFGYVDRSVAITALVVISILVTNPNYKYLNFIVGIFLGICVIASLSRTASFCVFILMSLWFVNWKSPKVLKQLIVRVFIGTTVFVFFVLTFRPILNRFSIGDQATKIGPIVINSEGRANIWQSAVSSTFDQAHINNFLPLVFGTGAGSATSNINAIWPKLTLVHNEYLRNFVDYGFFGLFLFVTALLVTIIFLFRQTRITSFSSLTVSSSLSFISILILSLTDNPLLYIYCYLPVFVLLGLVVLDTSSRK